MKVANLGTSMLMFAFRNFDFKIPPRSISESIVCDDARLKQIMSLDNYVEILRFEFDPSERVLLDKNALPVETILDSLAFKKLGEELALEAEKGTSTASSTEVDHVVTQHDLDNNPELGAEGVKLGDKISFTPLTKEELASQGLNEDGAPLTEGQIADKSQSGIVKEMGIDLASGPDSSATAVLDETGKILEVKEGTETHIPADTQSEGPIAPASTEVKDEVKDPIADSVEKSESKEEVKDSSADESNKVLGETKSEVSDAKQSESPAQPTESSTPVTEAKKEAKPASTNKSNGKK